MTARDEAEEATEVTTIAVVELVVVVEAGNWETRLPKEEGASSVGGARAELPIGAAERSVGVIPAMEAGSAPCIAAGS